MRILRDIYWWCKVQIAKLGVIVRHYIHFFAVDIWNLETDLQQLSRWRQTLIKDAKILLLMLTAFSSRQIGYQATALAYTSVLALVPFLAIVFWIAGDMGLADLLREFLTANLTDSRLVDTLLTSADKIVETSQSGLFGFISMFTLFWLVIALMINIVRVFDNVWGLRESRPLLKQLIFIVLILLLSPLVLTLFFAGSFVYSHILDLLIPTQTPITDQIKSLLGWLSFAAMTIFIISVMYKWIPSAKVRYRHALRAAIFSGLVFTGLQFLYLETQVMVAKTNAIYGVIAAIPLFLVWMNWGWSIILFGAELSYSMQRIGHGRISDEELNELIAIRKKDVKFKE